MIENIEFKEDTIQELLTDADGSPRWHDECIFSDGGAPPRGEVVKVFARDGSALLQVAERRMATNFQGNFLEVRFERA